MIGVGSQSRPECRTCVHPCLLVFQSDWLDARVTAEENTETSLKNLCHLSVCKLKWEKNQLTQSRYIYKKITCYGTEYACNSCHWASSNMHVFVIVQWKSSSISDYLVHCLKILISSAMLTDMCKHASLS